MENINFNSVLETPDCCVDSTPDDLKSVTFDEWDKNFIASFEENIFNLIDDDGKNVGFMLSPKGKGNPLFLSPDGKQLSPSSFRKTFASPANHVQFTPVTGTDHVQFTSVTGTDHVQFTPVTGTDHVQFTPVTGKDHVQFTPVTGTDHVQFTPVTGTELQGFPNQFSSHPSTMLMGTACQSSPQQTVPTTQPKKQLFPSETNTSLSPSDIFLNENTVKDSSLEDVLNTPLPRKGRLQAARLRFKLILEKAVEKTTERVNKLTTGSGESEVMVKHPELRHALGTQSGYNAMESHVNSYRGKHYYSRRQEDPKASTVTRKPYCKTNCNNVSRYSRIQPKPSQLHCFTLCSMKK